MDEVGGLMEEVGGGMMEERGERSGGVYGVDYESMLQLALVTIGTFYNGFVIIINYLTVRNYDCAIISSVSSLTGLGLVGGSFEAVSS